MSNDLQVISPQLPPPPNIVFKVTQFLRLARDCQIVDGGRANIHEDLQGRSLATAAIRSNPQLHGRRRLGQAAVNLAFASIIQGRAKVLDITIGCVGADTVLLGVLTRYSALRFKDVVQEGCSIKVLLNRCSRAWNILHSQLLPGATSAPRRGGVSWQTARSITSLRQFRHFPQHGN